MTGHSSWSGAEITAASAVDLAAAIAMRQVSSRAVVEAFLERIALLNPQRNALVQITGDAAMALAFELIAGEDGHDAGVITLAVDAFVEQAW